MSKTADTHDSDLTLIDPFAPTNEVFAVHEQKFKDALPKISFPLVPVLSDARQYAQDKLATFARKRSNQNRTPRPINCYMIFSWRFKAQPDIEQKWFKGLHMKEKNRLVSAAWEFLKDAGKQPWKDLADVLAADHAKKFEGYVYRPQEFYKATSKSSSASSEASFPKKARTAKGRQVQDAIQAAVFAPPTRLPGVKISKSKVTSLRPPPKDVDSPPQLIEIPKLWVTDVANAETLVEVDAPPSPPTSYFEGYAYSPSSTSSNGSPISNPYAIHVEEPFLPSYTPSLPSHSDNGGIVLSALDERIASASHSRMISTRILPPLPSLADDSSHYGTLSPIPSQPAGRATSPFYPPRPFGRLSPVAPTNFAHSIEYSSVATF